MGAAHRDVGRGNGLLLPLLCGLHLIPLPLPMPEKAYPGQEGKTHSVLLHVLRCINTQVLPKEFEYQVKVDLFWQIY